MPADMLSVRPIDSNNSGAVDHREPGARSHDATFASRGIALRAMTADKTLPAMLHGRINSAVCATLRDGIHVTGRTTSRNTPLPTSLGLTPAEGAHAVSSVIQGRELRVPASILARRGRRHASHVRCDPNNAADVVLSRLDDDGATVRLSRKSLWPRGHLDYALMAVSFSPNGGPCLAGPPDGRRRLAPISGHHGIARSAEVR
jgi:hypothetical protein